MKMMRLHEVSWRGTPRHVRYLNPLKFEYTETRTEFTAEDGKAIEWDITLVSTGLHRGFWVSETPEEVAAIAEEALS